MLETVNKGKVWFPKKISNVNKILIRLIKKKRKKIQNINIGNVRVVCKNTTDIKTKKKCHEYINVTKFKKFS